MKSVGDWLRSADPVDGEPPLGDGEVRRMRRLVMEAARTSRPPAAWQRPAWVAAAVVAVAVAGVSVEQMRRADRPSSAAAPPAGQAGPADESGGAVRRQLQFETPGGTRVIWVFNPDFELTEGDRP